MNTEHVSDGANVVLDELGVEPRPAWAPTIPAFDFARRPRLVGQTAAPQTQTGHLNFFRTARW